MGYTLWIFVLLPDGTVERYPRSRYEKFFDREAPIGVEVGSEARLVEVAIETRRGHPLQLLRVSFARYQLTRDGLVTEENRDRRMHDAVDAMSIASTPHSGSDVVSLEPFIARRRNRQEHTWQPDRMELHNIVEAINHDAAKEIAATDGRTVLPT